MWWRGSVACVLLGCGSGASKTGGGSSDGGSATAMTEASTPGTSAGATDADGTSTSTTGVDGSSTGGSTDEGGVPDCDPSTTGAAPGDDVPADYGFATDPPRMALADTFYTYDLRTNIGDCSTDRVWWRFVEGPPGAALEIDDATLAVGDELQWEDGGDPREAVKVAWDLAEVDSGCHAIEVRWRAWKDCGALDEGEWGPEVVQRWELAVRDNWWWSGDLHVHTRHSERGDEAGGVWAYYQRMVNGEPNDAGEDFADRRMRSLRGRLHWTIFSDHTDREHEECGRHFADWCADGENVDIATGRGVAQQITEQDPTVLLVVGSEISNQFDGHMGFVAKNPYPGHPVYAPGYLDDPTDYDFDVGYGVGVFRERWIDDTATNDEEIDLAHQLGGLVIVNHESAPTFWIEYDWTSLDFDGLEVWNGGNRHDQDDDSAFHGGLDVNGVAEDDLLAVDLPEDPIERSYVGMLKIGRWPMIAAGGSDVHDYNEIVCGAFPCDPTNAEYASPTTSVWAETFVWTDGNSGVLDGFAAGRTVVHDRSNFIDLRVVQGDAEHIVGDTIAGYAPGTELELRAFGRVSDYIDGDNRVLLVLGTNADPDDRTVDVLYNSEDDTHFVEPIAGRDHMRNIRPDSSFDRRETFAIYAARMGENGTYFVWAQFIPWHNPAYLYGNGRDMVVTSAVRITTGR